MDVNYYESKIKELINQAKEDNIVIGYYATKDTSAGIVIFDASQKDKETMEMALIPLS